MKFLSVCSGIEAASVAWGVLGWSAAGFAEIDAFPSAVLAHHYPDVPNLGDFTAIKSLNEPIDLLVGGTPCQSFSVAGRRAGLDDARGVLAFEYLALAGRLRPKWLVFENVPGLLSSNDGRDFGAILGALGELGYGWAYRVLDAQHFGVPQRRRRVFVVSCLGDWRRAAAVLLERASLRWGPAPGRAEGPGIASDAPAGTLCHSHGNLRADEAWTNRLVARAVTAHPGGRYDLETENFVTHALRADGFDAREDGTGRGTPLIAFDCKAGGNTGFSIDERPGALRGEGHGGGHAAVAQAANVRRLTPRECERLQGFPDDYTLVPYRGRMASDAPRYRAIGNSMAVPVVRWIGERIAAVEALS